MKITGRIISTIMMILCISMLTGCSASEGTHASGTADTSGMTVTPVTTDLEEVDIICQSALGAIMAYSDEELDSLISQAEAAGQTALYEGFSAWKNNKEEAGNLLKVTGSNVVVVGDEYIDTIEMDCENRDYVATIAMKVDGSSYTQIKFEPQYTFGEKMKKAALNLLVGMGTVFLVLIFLAILISWFEYIPLLGEKLSGKGKTKKAAQETAEEAPAESASDDTELAAVIAAAIAAYEGTSTDSLVVRSIKRVSNRSK